MANTPTTADVVSLLAAWGGPVDPAVLEALNALGVDTVMRALTAAIADLLGSAARDAEGDDALSSSILVDRAVALARSGQMATAAALAEPALGQAGLSAPARAALLRTAVLAHASDARVGDVDRIVEGLERSSFRQPFLQRVDSTHRFVHVLTGDPVARRMAMAGDVSTTVSAATGTLPLVMQAISSMLLGDGEHAVVLAEQAADGFRALAGDELASVDIWPAPFRLLTYGRRDARRSVDEWRSRGDAGAQAWVQPYHQANSGMIALAFGDIDDAAAEMDAALEAAAQNGQGWVSWTVAERARIDIVRGDLDAADRRMAAFRSSGRPNTLGFRALELALAEVAAARGESTDLLERIWHATVAENNRLWMLMTGLDHARAARRLGDAQLAETVLADLAALDGAPPGLAHASAFARAAARRSVDDLVMAVDDCSAIANVMTAARLAGDVAIIAAEIDPARARELGARASAELQELGAVGEDRLLVADLRGRGVRLGVRGSRSRPNTGWASLTPTEARIVDLVAAGSTGPDIARTLYISPRTVQTHVSHALGKLGLTNRLELAMAHAHRRQ
ncbi:MAG: transcriptional regulator, LuxR family [Ilumatobacteraceae bacterium]|nr:transcriptional regulator, LuxR family [Ilumatobacteraceae bacterium]